MTVMEANTGLCCKIKPRELTKAMRKIETHLAINGSITLTHLLGYIHCFNGWNIFMNDVKLERKDGYKFVLNPVILTTSGKTVWELAYSKIDS